MDACEGDCGCDDDCEVWFWYCSLIIFAWPSIFSYIAHNKIASDFPCAITPMDPLYVTNSRRRVRPWLSRRGHSWRRLLLWLSTFCWSKLRTQYLGTLRRRPWLRCDDCDGNLEYEERNLELLVYFMIIWLLGFHQYSISFLICCSVLSQIG